jgi:hypothetical protein
MTVRQYTSRSQQTTLTSAVTSGGTTINVANATALFATVSGASLTTSSTFTVVLDPDTALEEIVDVTGASSNTLTITRSVDAVSTATEHSAGAVVRHMIIGRDLRDSNTHIEANSQVHGLLATSGVVVGTAATQTLTNKTLTTPIVAGATLSGAITSTATITGGTLTGAIVTGLSAPSNGSDATTKTYVDSILGSATAAATSAASAATSASSAATSATAAATSASSASTSASSALTSQTAAATSASSASTSASSAATSASSASTQATAASTSATSALTSQTAAATSATSAAVSATAAATSATSSATSAAAALTSANSAATSAASSAASTSAAAASATAAATSATSAAASATAAATSATSAAASATAASTSASSALTSQTAAATSATSAAASATAAATSASSAATSASSAATTYDDFDDRYLGSKASPPTVDNDGNTLLVGAIYWNSTLNNMYVWSGAVWTQIATTSVYSAPTIGTTSIGSGATVSTINALTLSGGLASADPTASLGLATKQYVDTVTVGINFHAPVVAATTANIVGTYNNGSSGVGATFTVTATGVFILDGITTELNNRVLIKDQTTQTQNGIYTVTTAGTSGISAVLTRATDNDNNPAGEMANGDIVNATGGTVNLGKTFVNSTTGTITIGTTNITYSAYYAGLPSQAGSNGLYLTTNGTTPSWAAVSSYSAPTLGTTVVTSGTTITTITGMTDITLTAPGSIKDQLTMLLMGAI